MTTKIARHEVKLGRFQNVSNETYHKEMLYAYSKTDLEYSMLSMSNMVQRRMGPQQDSEALEFGSALHLRLEHYNDQDAYLKLIAAAPKADKRTVAGKAIHEAFEATSKGKIILDTEKWDLLENMLKAVQAHPDANALLNAKGINEETFVWQDPDSGVICKCRPDKRLLEAPPGLPDHIVLDWKSARSCNIKDLRNEIGERYHDMQAAIVLDGIKAVLGHDVGPFVNVFIEKGNKMRVVLGVVDEDSIEIGRRLYKDQLMKIADSQKSGIWPGFVDFSLPAWRTMGGF